MKKTIAILTTAFLAIADNNSNCIPPAMAQVNNSPSTSNIIINGKALNYHNKRPLAKLELDIIGTFFTSVTDKYGQFRFELPDSFLHRTIVLQAGEEGKRFMDSTSSIIPEETVLIDSLPFKKVLTLYRYPIEYMKIPLMFESIR